MRQEKTPMAHVADILFWRMPHEELAQASPPDRIRQCGEAVIICGDCLEVMRGMEPNSIDAIVTDPPYGLEFMGKEWDSFKSGDIAMRRNPEMDAVNAGASRQGGRQRACVDYQKRQRRDMTNYQESMCQVFTESLRVAKPGAFLLAFGGTRTFHRLACAIEDAGWEIRDCLMWVHGQGFPKSHNIGCKCGGSALQYSHVEIQENKGGAGDDLRGLREEVSYSPESSDSSETTDLLKTLQRNQSREGMGEAGIQRRDGSQEVHADVRPRESGLEGRSDVLPQARELQADQVCSMSGGVQGDGSEGRICDGASPHNGKGNGKAAIEAGNRPSQ
jgi:hypothetical protein